MTKSELITMIAESNEITKKSAGEMLDIVFNGVMDAIVSLPEDDSKAKVAIPGFGAFKKVVREPKECRNPQTGETVMSSKSVTVKFKVSNTFKSELTDK